MGRNAWSITRCSSGFLLPYYVSDVDFLKDCNTAPGCSIKILLAVKQNASYTDTKNMCNTPVALFGHEEEEHFRQQLKQKLIQALNECPGHNLPLDAPAQGVGIYALYYFGNNEFYNLFSRININGQCILPIYIGKATTEGRRTGRKGKPSSSPLNKRIKEHIKSIKETINLKIEDFKCKYVVLDEIWVNVAEEILIKHYSPLWNTVIDGFGIHHPGRGRRGQKRSQWDTLHPGRKWVEKLGLPAGEETVEQLREKINEYFEKRLKSQNSRFS